MSKNKTIKFYWYPKCSTCRKARTALTAAGVTFTEIDITEKPPAQADFKRWLKSGQVELKQLLNTSGQVYRELGGAQLLNTKSEAEILKLLAGNGKLVKRPLITDGESVTVGFRDGAAITKHWAGK